MPAGRSRDDEIQCTISVPSGEEYRFNVDGSSKLHRPVIKEKTSKDKLEVTKIEVKKKRVPKVSVFDIIDLD